MMQTTTKLHKSDQYDGTLYDFEMLETQDYFTPTF